MMATQSRQSAKTPSILLDAVFDVLRENAVTVKSHRIDPSQRNVFVSIGSAASDRHMHDALLALAQRGLQCGYMAGGILKIKAPNGLHFGPLSALTSITHRGITDTVSGWAKRTGIAKSTIWQRLNHMGWSVADALGTPASEGRRRGLQYIFASAQNDISALK